ncbi:MAG: hypothetical protein H6760_04325 [Candidatus Nomurabacteria bacterium]|nr:MAG: hypothetical protein H6760_04325 [Candidatus Nomurabacteria bacterium]
MQKYGIFALILVIISAFSLPVYEVKAAGLTSVSDTLDTLTQNVGADHTILFVTPTGVDASTDTITIDFTDFTVGSVDFTDIDLAVDDDNACDGTFSDKTLAATASAGTWGAAFASSVLTLTPPTDATSGEITADRCVQVQIGNNAASGNAQLTSPNDTSTHVIELAGNFGDSGKFALDFVTDDSVNVTATVDASITFSLSDTTIGFGTLSASNARWATGDTNGSASDSAAAHTISVGTNATDGYIVTYNGATLTSGGDTINVASITNDADGTPGTEEFGVSYSTDGDATIASGYDHNATPGNRDWAFVASTTTTFASETGPTATENISAFYIANIAANTEAGLYTTDITYIATATF